MAAPGGTLEKMVEEVRSGAATCEERALAAVEKTRERDGRLRAYISLNERAVEEARAVDARVRAGEDLACPGLTVSVKDNICVAGMPATCASRMLEGYEPPYDATAVERLRAGGAVFTGKTNMDEFAMGLTTEFSAYGPSRNPWDADRVPGGSSGGSAVSVSAGMCDASLGSDTGGSVRNPASFCGLVGYKPTYGLVSRYGLISYSNSIEQIGPLARTVRDAAFVLDIMAGRDPRDATTVGRGPGSMLDGIEGGVAGARVGIIRQMMAGGGAPQEAAGRAASALERLGASCEEVSLGSAEHAVAAYYTITSAEAGSNLARYDGIRYGHCGIPQEGYEFHAYVSKARGRFGPEATRRLILGGFVPSAGHAGRYLLKALGVRRRLAAEIGALLERVDVLLSPTVPVLPFRIGEKIDDPVVLFTMDFNTVAANLSGRPAVSVPFGTSGGLPVGVQLMGREMGDADLLRAARALEGAAGPPAAPPGAPP